MVVLNPFLRILREENTAADRVGAWQESRSHDHSNLTTGLYVRCHHSQENTTGQDQEQWALHQPVIGPAEP